MRFALTLLAALMLTTPMSAAEIKVIGSPGLREVYTQLLPGFEKSTGHHVTTIWGGVNDVAQRVANGEVADIVLLPRAQIDDLVRQGRVKTPIDIAKSGVGVAVRAGYPKIDLSSGDAVKKALLAAKSMSYSTGPSGVHMIALIKQWGIEDKVKSKIVVAPPDTPVGTVLLRGQADIGFQQVSELINVKGITYLGALPPDANEITQFTAALHAKAATPDAATVLIKYLSAPAAAATIRKTGMDPG